MYRLGESLVPPRLYFQERSSALPKRRRRSTRSRTWRASSELKEADKADLTSRVAAWVARKAAMNANYKPKKRKRRGGDWLPSPTQSFDNTASFDDDEEDDGEEEADEEAVDLLVGLTQIKRPAVARSPHDEGAAELLAALAGSPPPPSNAALLGGNLRRRRRRRGEL